MADTTALKDRFLGAMLCHCLGDSLGAIWEGSPPFTGYLKTDRVLRYTDDTEMMLNLTKAILRHKKVLPEAVAEEFVSGFSPWRGYGPGTIKVLQLIKRGVHFTEASRAFFPEGSMGNGAAMRVTPVGLLYHNDIDRLREATRLQAQVTHAHPLAIEGAYLVALSVAMATKGMGLERILEEVPSQIRHPVYRDKIGIAIELLKSETELQEVVKRLGNGVLAHESTVTAFYLFIRSEGNPLKAIEMAIQIGGDTDTIAAMAGAMAGAFSTANTLSPQLLEAIEDYERIIEYSTTLYEIFTEGYSA